MRKSVRRGAIIVLVAIILAAAIGHLRRDALRVLYHRMALKRVERGLYYQMNQPRTLLQWISSWTAEPYRSPFLWQKLGYHEDALVGLGYLARHEFPFTNRTLNAVRLRDTAQARFGSRMTRLCVLTNGQSISASAVCTASVVQVTAPRDEAEKWRALVNEFDQIARQNQ